MKKVLMLIILYFIFYNAYASAEIINFKYQGYKIKCSYSNIAFDDKIVI